MPLEPLHVDNLDLVCRDIKPMRAFYQDLLGLPLLFPFEEGSGWFAVQAGPVTLYVFETSSRVDNVVRVHVASEDPPGLSAFGLSVNDLDAAIVELDGRVTWAGETREWRHPAGTWYRFRPLRDPEGNVLSITETHKV